jgi:hypothetical protein
MTLQDWAREQQALAGDGRSVSRPSAPKTAIRVAEVLPFAEKAFAAKLEGIAEKIAEAMPGKIDAAGLSQQAVAMAVLIDKARLLRGQPGVITQNVAENLSDDDLLGIASGSRPRTAETAQS